MVETCSSGHTLSGGHVSAVVGTLGAFTSAMAANLTLARKGWEDYQDETKDFLEKVMMGIEELKG